MDEQLRNQGFWEEAWVRHIEAYLSAPPRCGHWLRARFRLQGWRVLELGGGSCRDSRVLAEGGVQSVGTDFEEKTLQYLRQRFEGSPLPLRREDASALSFENGAFDLSFHNGFWVLFDDPARVVQLLREQARVTRRTLVAVVHNADNTRLVEAFKRKSARDPLYDIHFLSRRDLASLCEAAGLASHQVRFEKFGGPVDMLYALPWIFKPWARWLAPRLYRLQPWSATERVAMVVDL